MVNLGDGWNPIVEELIRAELETRGETISLVGRSLHRLRNGLLARIDQVLEERFALVLEEAVTAELELLSDAELSRMVTDTDLDHLDLEVMREVFETALENERRRIGGDQIFDEEAVAQEDPEDAGPEIG